MKLMFSTNSFREMQIKCAMKYHLIPFRKANQNLKTHKCWQGFRNEDAYAYGENENSTGTIQISVQGTKRNLKIELLLHLGFNCSFIYSRKK